MLHLGDYLCAYARAVPSAPARTIVIAPTAGTPFGLRRPRGGYDGTIRSTVNRT